jgi:hypothetical protein
MRASNSSEGKSGGGDRGFDRLGAADTVAPPPPDRPTAVLSKRGKSCGDT